MIRESVKVLMCENDRLKELMRIPISDILSYCDNADSVDPEEAVSFLADRFIDNCGILGMRDIYDSCASYWIEKMDLENNPILNEKYHNASTLRQILPYISDKYYDEILNKYDSCSSDAAKLRDGLIELLKTETEEKNKIILCAGIWHSLIWADDRLCWLDQYSSSEIEEGILQFESRDLIRYRQEEDFQRYRTRCYAKKTGGKMNSGSWVEQSPDEFTEEEINHFIILNDRLVELQREVMDQVKVITANLQEQIAKGFHQYETFCVAGYIYVDPFEEEETNELLDVISSFAKHFVINSNDHTKIETLESDILKERHWYANWSGVYHILEESHGLKVCRAFCDLFEEDELFTMEDIMKIKPEMFLPHVEINI